MFAETLLVGLFTSESISPGADSVLAEKSTESLMLCFRCQQTEILHVLKLLEWKLRQSSLNARVCEKREGNREGAEEWTLNTRNTQHLGTSCLNILKPDKQILVPEIPLFK